jgi:superfamily II DNA helicase RecQ
MQYHMYTLSIFGSEDELEKLNVFLRSNRIFHVEKQFFVAGQDAYWSFCIEYEGKILTQTQGKIDYKELLSENDFAIYSKLREMRKTCAKEQNIPLYMIFTNEQLVEMIHKKTATVSDLEKINGVGKSKIDTYGGKFAAFLGTIFKTDHETEQ